MSEGGKTKRPHDRRLNDLVAVTVVVLTVGNPPDADDPYRTSSEIITCSALT